MHLNEKYSISVMCILEYDYLNKRTLSDKLCKKKKKIDWTVDTNDQSHLM